MDETNEKRNKPRTLKTSTTTLKIINGLKELNGATVTEMADYLGLSKGGAYNHLATLREQRFVVKKGTEYALGPMMVLIGEHVRRQNRLYQFGKKEIDELVEETGEYGQLVTEQNGLAIVLYLKRGKKAIGSDYPDQMEQKPLMLHHLAAGKAILQRLPEWRVDEIIAQHGLPELTANTITNEDKLKSELNNISEVGYATNMEEEVTGLRSVGAAINGPSGEVLGALSISGPKSRFQGERLKSEIPEKVVQTAGIVEVNINMHSKSKNL